MAIYERTGRLMVKNADGDQHILYPDTKISSVEGLPETLQSIKDVTIIKIKYDDYLKLSEEDIANNNYVVTDCPDSVSMLDMNDRLIKMESKLSLGLSNMNNNIDSMNDEVDALTTTLNGVKTLVGNTKFYTRTAQYANTSAGMIQFVTDTWGDIPTGYTGMILLNNHTDIYTGEYYKYASTSGRISVYNSNGAIKYTFTVSAGTVYLTEVHGYHCVSTADHVLNGQVMISGGHASNCPDTTHWWHISAAGTVGQCHQIATCVSENNLVYHRLLSGGGWSAWRKQSSMSVSGTTLSVSI